MNICVPEIALRIVLKLELQKRGIAGAAKVVKLIPRYIQSPLNAYKRFLFYEVNLGIFKIEYHGLKM